MDNEAITKIKEILSALCPDYDINGYQTMDIEALVKHFAALGKVEKSHFMLSFTEGVQVDILNNVVEHIKKDLIEDKHNYLWRDDQPKDDYERGVLNVIRLIQHRIHCICD